MTRKSLQKSITVQCPEEVARIFVLAATNYLEVAFPRGSTDCAQVAREAMQTAISDFEREYQTTGSASYNKRLRAMVREAIKLHYQLQSHDDGRRHEAERDLLLEVVGGRPCTARDLQQARARDQEHSPG